MFACNFEKVYNIQNTYSYQIKNQIKILNNAITENYIEFIQ